MTRSDGVLRRRAVPIGLALAVAAAAIIFWRPLVEWFTGGPGHGEHAVEEEKRGGGEQGESAVAASLPPLELSEPALAAVQNGLAAYEVIRAELARDRLEGVKAPAGLVASELRAAASALGSDPAAAKARETLVGGAAAADLVAAASQIAEARRWFGEVTRAVVALALADPRLRSGRHLFSCPMVDGGYDKWLQTSSALENPYMGQSMATCGGEAEWAAPVPAAAPVNVSHEGHGHRGADVSHYTCGMHPWVQQKQPGKCPICAMELSPITYEETESGVVRVDAARRERIGVKTARAERTAMAVSIRAVGRLTYDETRLKDVTLKVKGWIVKLRVNSTGQPVRRGDTMFSLYSPELHAAQQEYLLALDSERAAGGPGSYLLEAAEKKLRLWDVPPSVIAELARRGKPIEELPIAAPASGYVIEKNVVEGAAVEPGQRLYRIASLDKVWVEAQVYEADLGAIKKGQKALVTLPYRAGEPVAGTVAYVFPYLDPSSRTGRVRIELRNEELAFKPDMYVNVELRVDLGPRLQIPIDAVVYTGPRRLVFVDVGQDRLRPQEVRLGARSGDTVEVLAGLRDGDLVVTSANFLIAAESRIRSAAQLWDDEVSGEHAGH